MRNQSTAVFAALLFGSGCLFGAGPESTDGTNSASSNNASSSNNSTTSPALCGNGRIDLGETCDPCDDYQCPSGGCALYAVVGSAETCDLRCEPNGQVSACANDDGCCPSGCTAANDSDCSPLCGNGNLDEGELCDPCPVCASGTACQPLTVLGDASTCDLQCITGPARPECCGLNICGPDQMCVDEMCEGGTTCNLTPTPDTFCQQQQPGTVCVGTECVVPGCLEDSDCLPWEVCPAGTCEVPTTCAAAPGPRQTEWCLRRNFQPGQQTFVCYPMGPETACTAYMPVYCNDASQCDGWETCETTQGCIIAEKCDQANDSDLYCVFQLGRGDAKCIGDECL